MQPLLPSNNAVTAAKPSAQMSEMYLDMITSGLAGADKLAPGFSSNYSINTYQSNRKPLKFNKIFTEMLFKKTKNFSQ